MVCSNRQDETLTCDTARRTPFSAPLPTESCQYGHHKPQHCGPPKNRWRGAKRSSNRGKSPLTPARNTRKTEKSRLAIVRHFIEAFSTFPQITIVSACQRACACVQHNPRWSRCVCVCCLAPMPRHIITRRVWLDGRRVGNARKKTALNWSDSPGPS